MRSTQTPAPRVSALLTSPHALSPVPKTASLKIAGVPLCYRYFPAPEDFGQESFFPKNHSIWMIPDLDNQNLSFLAISHLFVESESKCLRYKSVRDFMKELVQIQSCFTSKKEGRTTSGKHQPLVVGMLSGQITYLRTSSPEQ